MVLLAVSLSWAMAVDLTPASARPYVGSTQDNSELSLALGYNGLNRLLGNNGGPRADGGVPAGASAEPGTTTQLPADLQPPTNAQAPADGSTTGTPAFPDRQAGVRPDDGNGGFPGGGPGGGGPGGTGENGPKGVLRLLDQQLGGQIGWLIPFALAGLLAGGWRLFVRRSSQLPVSSSQQDDADLAFSLKPAAPARFFAHIGRLLRTPLDLRQQAVVLWGTWFLTMAAFFSIAGMFHRYYLSMLAPGMAALVGIGVAILWHAYRQRQPARLASCPSRS